MSTNALLACLALLYGIANADPAAFTVTGADPDAAVSATVAAGLKSVSVSLSGLGNSIGLPPGGTPHANAGSAGGTTVATAEPFVADMQPFAEPFNMRGGPAASQSTGLDYLIPVIDRAGTFTPNAADASTRALLTGVSFTFGAELYVVDATPVAEDPERSSGDMMILGFVGVGLMPYLVARALLPRPALSAFTIQSK